MRKLSLSLVVCCFYLLEANASPAYNSNNVGNYHIGGSDCKYGVFYAVKDVLCCAFLHDICIGKVI